MVTNEQIERIKELRNRGFSASKIAKEIHLRKQDTLEIVRTLEGKRLPKSSKIIHTPTKYLSVKRKEKKEKIIIKIREKKERKKPLSKKEKEIVKEKVKKREPDYKIEKDFSEFKRKKIRKEIKSAKKKEKKEKLKDINKKYENKCKFNYITQHHIGYEFEKSCSFVIYEGISDYEINEIIKNIISSIKVMNAGIRCSQRIHYTSLEYKITLMDGSFEYSKISTNINTSMGISSFKTMLEQIPDIVYYLVNLVHQAQSPKEIEIYNIIYVNYDFKNNVKGNIFV